MSLSDYPAFQELLALPKFGSGSGLERCARVLQRLCIIPNTFPAIGITGSNGKGATSALVAALLRETGRKVGLYTSPHFLEPEERFQINGRTIEPGECARLLEELFPVLRQVETEQQTVFSRFEVLTVLALQWFAKHTVDVMVLEAGIGGRLDTTRLAVPEVTAITSLDLEHTELLGETLEEIFLEKLQLGDEGGVCIASLPDSESFRTDAMRVAQQLTRRLLLLEEYWEVIHYPDPGQAEGEFVRKNGERLVLRLPLVGHWQARNAAIAIAVVETFLGAQLPIEVIQQAFQKVVVPGRFQRVLDEPSMFVDAAHTPDAVRCVMDEVLGREACGESFALLVGMSAKKKVQEMVRELSRVPHPVFVSASAHGGAPAEDLAALLRCAGMRVLAASDDLAEIVSKARNFCMENQQSLLAVGGLFFAADVCRVLRGERCDAAVYL